MIPDTARGRTAHEGRVELSRQVDAITARQVAAWRAAWLNVYDDLVQAARTFAAAPDDFAAGVRAQRLRDSLGVLSTGLRELGRTDGVRIGPLVYPTLQVTLQTQEKLLRATGLVPERALQAIVNRTAGNITSGYARLTTAAETELRAVLVRSIAAGTGSRAAARILVANTQSATAQALGTSLQQVQAGRVGDAIVSQVQAAFAGGLARANTLVRTELLDASRTATRDAYAAQPGLVTGWRWLSTLDRRTCPACWGMHNTIHPVIDTLEGHQNCRCTQVPILVDDDGDDDLGSPDVALRALPAAQQLAILGPARLVAFQQGTPLRAMAQHQQNPGWRPSYTVAPLSSLQPAA